MVEHRPWHNHQSSPRSHRNVRLVYLAAQPFPRHIFSKSQTPSWQSTHRVSYTDPKNSSDFSVRAYYTVADNFVKEKIFNPSSGWADGTLNVQTIPGSNIGAIVWISGDDVVIRAYIQSGQQVSAISEWAGTRTAWAQGALVLPPAVVWRPTKMAKEAWLAGELHYCISSFLTLQVRPIWQFFTLKSNHSFD